MARVELSGVWLHDPADPHGTARRFKFNGDGAEESFQIEAVTTRVAGRVRPVVDFGEGLTEELTFTLATEAETTDLAELRRIVRSQRVMCYRDFKGRKWYAVLRTGSTRDAWWGAETQVTVTAVDDPRNGN